MTLREEFLAFHNMDMKDVVGPGVFEIMVGQCSRERDLREVILRVR